MATYSYYFLILRDGLFFKLCAHGLWQTTCSIYNATPFSEDEAQTILSAYIPEEEQPLWRILHVTAAYED